MTTDATLAALTAGLAEDEAIARATIDSLRRSDMDTGLRYEGDVGTWIAEPQKHGAGVRSIDGEIREEGEPESWRGPRQVIFSGDGEPTSEAAEHIARFDPKRALRQVAAVRMVVEVLTAGGCSWCDDDARKDFEPVLRALAGIYTEPTEEG